jgi:hypothetical protein
LQPHTPGGVRPRPPLLEIKGLTKRLEQEQGDTRGAHDDYSAVLPQQLFQITVRIPGNKAIADAGYESRKLARTLMQHQGWQLRIVKRRQRAFKITGLTWIVRRSFAWLGRNRRLSKDYE